MSLVFCPECGHEISLNAVACPNCGLPLSAQPPVEHKTVVHQQPRVVSDKLPPWAIAVFGIMAVALMLTLVYVFSSSGDKGNINATVNTNARGGPSSVAKETRVTNVPSTETAPATVPQTQTSVPSTTTSVPSTSAPPALAPPPTDKGSVVIKAQVVTDRGTPQPARGIKFYLLDKDVESILQEAGVTPIEGNTLSGSLGLAAVFPDRYGEFQRSAMRAIGAHVKYSGSSDSSGTASLGGSVKPNGYYLFSVARAGKGFAIWNAPVSVVPGQNILDLGPQSITDISNSG